MNRREIIGTIIGTVALALLVTWAVARGDVKRTNPPVPGVYYDDGYYSALVLPAGMYLCRSDSTGYLRCLALPDGTVLLYPVPQELR